MKWRSALIIYLLILFSSVATPVVKTTLGIPYNKDPTQGNTRPVIRSTIAGNYLFTYSPDGRIIIWNLLKNNIYRVFEGYNNVNIIQVNGDHLYIVIDNTVYVINWKTQELISMLRDAEATIVRLIVMEEDHKIYALTSIGYIYIWKDFSLHKRKKINSAVVYGAYCNNTLYVISPSGRFILLDEDLKPVSDLDIGISDLQKVVQDKCKLYAIHQNSVAQITLSSLSLIHI